MTIDTQARYGCVAAFLSKYFSGGHNGCGNSAAEPMNTITGVDHNAIVAANIVKLKGQDVGQAADGPLQTITAGGKHFAAVQAFLIKYYGQGFGQNLSDPMHTVTEKDHFGLVTILDVDYAIVDIGLRMLTPRELYAGNGAPPDYIIDHDVTGRYFTKEKQVAMCGNMVPPQLSEALVRANLPELCGEKISTMAELEMRVAM